MSLFSKAHGVKLNAGLDAVAIASTALDYGNSSK